MTDTVPEPTLGTADPTGPAPTREDLDGLTADELHDRYGVPKGRKTDMVAAVLQRYDVPQAGAGEVVLKVNPLHSDAHYWDAGSPPITPAGTVVPEGKADQIIAQAALGGVQIRKVS